MNQDRIRHIVYDELGREYQITKTLGMGGQGKVYLDETGDFLIKLRKKSNDPNRSNILRDRLKHIQTFPLDAYPITRPLALLRPPEVGYVMENLMGMEPIRNLFQCSRKAREESSLRFYIESGGLRRRLHLLARCANILSRLHSKSLIYGDLSGTNIFVSTDINRSEVYLIDIDNLRYSTEKSICIGTPYFMAPEIFKRALGVDFLSDSYSFAVIAFLVLTGVHPFLDGFQVKYRQVSEERAMKGKVPWVLQPDSPNDLIDMVFPAVLSEQLLDLFKRTFEDGLVERTKRPSMAEWAEAFEHAAHLTVKCTDPQCGYSYLYNTGQCPVCETPCPDIVHASIFQSWFENGDKKQGIPFGQIVLAQHDQQQLHVIFNDGYSTQSVSISIENIGNNLIHASSDSYGLVWALSPVWAAADMLKTHCETKRRISNNPLEFKNSWTIAVGDPTRTHTVIRFDAGDGA